jgi:hypothetical protein
MFEISLSTGAGRKPSGSHKVGVWGPRRTALARIIRELRKEGGK